MRLLIVFRRVFEIDFGLEKMCVRELEHDYLLGSDVQIYPKVSEVGN